MNNHRFISGLQGLSVEKHIGTVSAIMPGWVHAKGPRCALGDVCEIFGDDEDQPPLLAEVAGVSNEKTVLVPLEQVHNILPGARIVRREQSNQAPVGDAYAGRMIDALGRPLDGRPQIVSKVSRPLSGKRLQPLERQDTRTLLQTSIRALDGLVPIGIGQRVGIFAASGVGKTSLLEQIGRHVTADRIVMCLTGERGREVDYFWSVLSDDQNIERLSAVVATSDQSATLRIRAVYQALALAEYWRDQGQHVVLFLDSITRLAMALREIGLAAGEPPTMRAYTTNVFDALPKIVERCGAAKEGGTITAIMTVLSETDDADDPIVETMKSLLDGHIILSRELAEKAHFPAIDIGRSISRLAGQIMDAEHSEAAQTVRAYLATYEDARMMIESGIYKKGSNRQIDLAIAKAPGVEAFLRQSQGDVTPFETTKAQLITIASGGPG